VIICRKPEYDSSTCMISVVRETFHQKLSIIRQVTWPSCDEKLSGEKYNLFICLGLFGCGKYIQCHGQLCLMKKETDPLFLKMVIPFVQRVYSIRSFFNVVALKSRKLCRTFFL
jgi:hypothetical protein